MPRFKTWAGGAHTLGANTGGWAHFWGSYWRVDTSLGEHWRVDTRWAFENVGAIRARAQFGAKKKIMSVCSTPISGSIVRELILCLRTDLSLGPRHAR